MKILAIVSVAALALPALPAAASQPGGFLTVMRVGATFSICRDRMKTAYGVGPRKILVSEQFKTDAHVDANGDRLVRYTGFTQETGQKRVAIAGVCHVRRNGPSTIEVGQPE